MLQEPDTSETMNVLPYFVQQVSKEKPTTGALQECKAGYVQLWKQT